MTYILNMVATREVQLLLVEDLRDIHTGHDVITPYE